MLNIRTLRVLAVAEMRFCRRLARTWVFVVVAFIVCIGWYGEMVDYSQWPFPPNSWADDEMTARYTISTMMNGFVSIFSIGVIFLSFDIRGRDVHDRISDVVDSLPASNVEIIFGRIAGILILVLIPCLVFLALITGYEAVSGFAGSRFRLGIQPVSVMSLFVWNLIPNLVFYCALVACLAALIRVRLLVAIIALGVFVGLFWIDNHIPVRFQESLSQFLGGSYVPSDLAPVFASPAIVGNKCAILLVSIALLFFAASILPRTEPRRRLTTILGFAALGVAVVVFIGLLTSLYGSQNLKEDWLKEHRQQHPTSFPDIQHLQGTVELMPGRKITLDVLLTVHKPTMNTTDWVVFSLNPGYKIQELAIDGEKTTNFSFEAGLLKLPSELLPNSSHDIRVQAAGKPDDRFAYLDQARDFQTYPNRSVRQLGLRNSIFHGDFVALMPCIAWYPISGSVADRDRLDLRRRDLFTIDLTVSVPSKWQVATVGTRKVLDDQERSQFQFTSGVPVPELALLASNFDRRTTTIEGVEFEVLFNKKHVQNLDALAPFTKYVNQWVAERIENARAISLAYPYEVFYVVEVPSNLRIYGGGWRMTTVLQPPRMMLVRESSFPTEQFEFVTHRERSVGHLSKDAQDHRIFDELQRYFVSDLHGGSPFSGFARNFVSHQISATQRGAIALQHLLEQLSIQLITETESFSIVSMMEFDTYTPNLRVGYSPDTDFAGFGDYAVLRRVQIAGLPSTRRVMDQIALFDLDFNGNPILSHRVLLTKGHALARSMISYYGAETMGVFLKALLTEFRGQQFTVADFLDVGSKIGLDFDEWVLPWLEDTILPGYLFDAPIVSKLETEESGDAQYQTTFVIHNAESMSGLVRIFWAANDTNNYRDNDWPSGNLVRSDPIFIAAHHSMRFAVRSVIPLKGLWVEPFLAHNVEAFEVPVPDYDEYANLNGTALPFVADVDWRPPELEGIIVDDLDLNFSIVARDLNTGDFGQVQTVTASSETTNEYVQGLPVGQYLGSNEWNRVFNPSSFGQYLRTYSRIARGEGKTAARFEVRLPHDGQWRLEYYVPKPAFVSGGYGVSDLFGYQTRQTRSADPRAPEEHYRLVIRDGDAEWNEQFDIANAIADWNEVGEYQLGSTEVEVFVSDWAGHEEVLVHADAIRWTPVELD